MEKTKELKPSRHMTQVEPQTKGEIAEENRLSVKVTVGKKGETKSAQDLR